MSGIVLGLIQALDTCRKYVEEGPPLDSGGGFAKGYCRCCGGWIESAESLAGHKAECEYVDAVNALRKVTTKESSHARS